jgi:hypothetical protein
MEKLIQHLIEQKDEGEALLRSARGDGERNTLSGFIQALDEVLEFIEENYEDEEE